MHKKILCEQQCGFNNGLSTNILVANLLMNVHDGLGSNKFGNFVFLDLRKAFDMQIKIFCCLN